MIPMSPVQDASTDGRIVLREPMESRAGFFRARDPSIEMWAAAEGVHSSRARSYTEHQCGRHHGLADP